VQRPHLGLPPLDKTVKVQNSTSRPDHGAVVRRIPLDAEPSGEARGAIDDPRELVHSTVKDGVCVEAFQWRMFPCTDPAVPAEAFSEMSQRSTDPTLAIVCAQEPPGLNIGPLEVAARQRGNKPIDGTSGS